LGVALGPGRTAGYTYRHTPPRSNPRDPCRDARTERYGRYSSSPSAGFAGATLRYAVSLLAPGLLGTLTVNAVGSLALGFLVYEAVGRSALSEASRTLLTTGFSPR